MSDETIYNGLSSEAYIDQRFWSQESKSIFSDNWVFVA